MLFARQNGLHFHTVLGVIVVSDYPKPHIEGRWSKDIEEDYRNARSDDERRRILLEVGYTPDYMSEVKRLFDAPLELENRIKDEKKKAMIEKLKRHWKPIVGIFSVVIGVLTFFSLLPGAWDGFLWFMERIRSIF